MKYWFQRYRLFSKFDKGILMDRGKSFYFLAYFKIFNTLKPVMILLGEVITVYTVYVKYLYLFPIFCY